MTRREKDEYGTTLTKPAIGTIANGQNGDAIVRTVLRANDNGYHVLIFHYDLIGSEIIELVERLGATVLSSPAKDLSSSPKAYLRKVARAYGFPGLIFHENTDTYIDFESSIDALNHTTQYGIHSQIRSPHVNSDQQFVLVAIPAFNEADTIAQVVSDALHHADHVLVIDDGSSDNTGKLASAAGAEIVQHNQNQGYGAALKTAFQEARRRAVDHLVILDGDGQHDSEDIFRLIAIQKNTNAEMVIGSRFIDDRTSKIPLYRRFGLLIVNTLTNLSIGRFRPHSWIKDTQSGFRAYNQDAIESIAQDESINDGMSASTDICFHGQRHDFRIEEVGTSIYYDVDDANTINPIFHGIALVNNILMTIESERPITVLGVPGFFSILIGLVFSNWTFTNYLRTETLPLGVAIASTFFLLCGLFACFTSIILHSLNTSKYFSS